jgi:hypothetical protein
VTVNVKSAGTGFSGVPNDAAGEIDGKWIDPRSELPLVLKRTRR